MISHAASGSVIEPGITEGKPLLGRAVVLTGAGQGIGAACAIAAANLGAKVVVNDIDGKRADETCETIRKRGGIALANSEDISQWHQAGKLIDACVEEWGRIDGLVNNAALFRMARLEEQSESDARAMLEVNVMGTLACAAHAITHMRRQNAGSIVNVTSGAEMGEEAMGAYGATKGAVASMTYAWAVETSGTPIRVNAISPVGRTRMNEEWSGYRSKHLPESVQLDSEQTVFPSSESNAPVVCFLLSDLASGVHGQVVRTEGKKLSLMSHPAIALPILNDDWTFIKITAAFDRELKQRQLPVGMAELESIFKAVT
ncbi:SDR family NAD(P)-dependent oxidoreductase [Rhizobium jaguaris]|uniref:SDR family oxidoreductase n=1 Tax=Rhizobium jaguaris TaxID=1312183 RepID=A0A387G8E3_9HYPH|nr:SDR family oxidoreductase [Rhizobium jaguaris]AYG64121.1 SDR family oxidoreductase [Rhizobium jaguaris]